jgi:hypothetical protein
MPAERDVLVPPPRSRFGSEVFSEADADDKHAREEVSFPKWAAKAWDALQSQPALAVALCQRQPKTDQLTANEN